VTHRKYEVGTLVVDGWAVTFRTVSLLAVPNVTAHSSTASVPTIVLLYSSLLLCVFDEPVKGLKLVHRRFTACSQYIARSDLLYPRHPNQLHSEWANTINRWLGKQCTQPMRLTTTPLEMAEYSLLLRFPPSTQQFPL